MYPRARSETYTIASIRNSFATTSIVPLDAQRVLEKLNVKHTPPPIRPETSGSDSSGNFVPHTPARPIDLKRQATSIKTLLRQRSYTPPSPAKTALMQLVKGCEIAMHNGAILAQEVTKLRAQLG